MHFRDVHLSSKRHGDGFEAASALNGEINLVRYVRLRAASIEARERERERERVRGCAVITTKQDHECAALHRYAKGKEKRKRHSRRVNHRPGKQNRGIAIIAS